MQFKKLHYTEATLILAFTAVWFLDIILGVIYGLAM